MTDIKIKRYLVTAGDDYYPSSGSGNWKKSFDDLDIATEFAKSLANEKSYFTYRYDWVMIIDLFDFSETDVKPKNSSD